MSPDCFLLTHLPRNKLRYRSNKRDAGVEKNHTGINRPGGYCSTYGTEISEASTMEPRDIRLFISDVDGTLLNARKELTRDTYNAIRHLRAANVLSEHHLHDADSQEIVSLMEAKELDPWIPARGLGWNRTLCSLASGRRCGGSGLWVLHRSSRRRDSRPGRMSYR
jgi:hypothetical protein